MSMPERLNVMKVVSYDVAKVADDMFKETGVRPINASEVLDWIEPWIQEDFSCGHGHEVSLRDLIVQDENGEEL